jgi:AraC-like DNA-binding protein
MKSDYSSVAALANSRIYQEYQKAFTGATGLPLSLRSVDSGQLPHHGTQNESWFCAIMAQQGRSCANCLRVQRKLREKAACRPYTVVCGAGISETAVPVRLGDKLVGFLHTGQVLLGQPTAGDIDRTAKIVSGLEVDADAPGLRNAYFGTRVLSLQAYASAVGLLRVFAQHLAIVSNQLLVQGETAEPLAITRAKEFINDHHTDDLSLKQVAKAVNVSTFYFCKLFRRVTGVKFTEYLSRVRIEKAKSLLLNRNLRISEISYEVGFQSLTHFNRIFKAVVGQSPTEYRDLLPKVGIGNCRSSPGVERG